MKKFLVLILSVVAAFAAILSLTACEASKKSFAESAAKQVISGTLKSPSSAVWHEVSYIENNEKGQYVVFVDVEATNSFGAYIRTKFFVIVQNLNLKDETFSCNKNFSYIECSGKNDANNLLLLKNLNDYDGNISNNISNSSGNGSANGGGSSGGDSSGSGGSQGGAGKPSTHSHSFTEERVEENYLKSAATCTAKAVYYYSCKCGEKGTQTFEYGDKLPHTYTKQIAEENYLKSAATCTAKAVYYYSCKCGEKGTQTFEYGDKLPHNFNKQIAEDKYLKSAATCTAKAVYYYSCKCGEKGTQTFEYGDKLPHTFDKQITEERYLKSAATCTAKAVYYYSCKCGEKGTQSFEYGEPLPHEYNDSYICTNCSYKCKSDGLSFELSTDNNSYVCTGLGTFNGKILIIPCEYNGKPVTKIEEDAFKNATDITDVLIPDSVTEVGFNAFGGCNSIAKMVLPFVGAYADGSCDENIGYIFGASSYNEHTQKLPSTLKTIVLSDSITKIGDYAFYNCASLTNVTIWDSVTSIGYAAFRGCSSLTSITIPDGVTSIGESAFKYCSKLTSITIPDSVTSIGYGAFYECSKLTSVTIGNGVTSIDDYAFYYCTSLTSVTIGDSVTSIGSEAFSGCSSLTSVTIGDSVTSIGGDAFSGCESLTKIYYSGNVNNWVQIDGLYWVMNYGNSNKELYMRDVLLVNTIIDTATEIKSRAFYNCTSLTSVTIGDSVTSIGSEAFSGCSSLEFNKYDNGLYLGNETNKYVALIKPKTQGVKSITINNKCKVIGNSAFMNCTSLTSVTIPDSVTSIGSEAFKYCSKLTSITIPDGVTSIGWRTFEGCTSLTSITIPDGVTSIGNDTFFGCTSLTSVTIGDGVTSIGSYAFAYCSSLKTINYKGSKEQWDAISKGSNWNYGTGSFTINYNYVEN